MAEFLIINKDHWSEEEPQATKDNWSAGQVKKFNASPHRGDIIEVQPDGKWEEKPGFNPNFCVIKVPGLSVENARKYVTDIQGPGGESDILRRYKHRIITTQQFETMNLATFVARIIDKTPEAQLEIIT